MNGGYFRSGRLRFFVDLEQTLQIDGTAHAKDERFVEFKGGDQALDDFRVRAFFDFQANRFAFAALCDLRVDGFEQVAGFFFFEVEIAVARDAEWSGRQNFVAAIELGGVGGDDVLEEDVVNVRRGF